MKEYAVKRSLYTKSYSIYLFWVITFFTLFQACSVNQSVESKLLNQIKSHGTIPVEIEEDGNIKTIEVITAKIDSLDEEQLNQIIYFFSGLQSTFPETHDYVFIKYYPGKDQCNSTGSATRDNIGRGNKKFKNAVLSRDNMTAHHIYKSNEGINRWDKGIDWIADDDHIIENTFFEYHYPCSSYVILHKSGKYSAYFGESWIGKQISDIDLFVEFIMNNNGGI